MAQIWRDHCWALFKALLRILAKWKIFWSGYYISHIKFMQFHKFLKVKRILFRNKRFVLNKKVQINISGMWISILHTISFGFGFVLITFHNISLLNNDNSLSIWTSIIWHFVDENSLSSINPEFERNANNCH